MILQKILSPKLIARLLPLFFAMLSSLSSCIQVIDTIGPNGPDGYAYFGVDYDIDAPYSYWDNNPSIPLNPNLGSYYNTYPGIYDFEYFINSDEYYYGTYEIYVNPGYPGNTSGRIGLRGEDTYLMLVVDFDGWYEDRYKNDKNIPFTIEKKMGNKIVTIRFEKANINDRQAHSNKITPYNK